MIVLKLRSFLLKLLQKINNRHCCRMALSHAETLFGPEATIHNPQQNKDAISIGSKTLIDGELLVFDDHGRIQIGSSTYIGKGSRVWSGDNVKIGDHVFVAHNCTITDTNAHQFSASERAADYQTRVVEGKPYKRGSTKTASIVIENHVWINFGVSVLRGVKIGGGAIIGAGSVVTKNVEPWTFVAGAPAKFVKLITER
jgi:acetyltransferase-like isoleucine patch superfamily enzyme